jgi:NADH-quinone oxidoreductase subunit E
MWIDEVTHLMNRGVMLREKYPDEVQAILAKYPPDQKRSAVMPLLYLAQRELGYITKGSLSDIGEIVGISATDVASLVGYYTLYHEHPGGKFRVQVCNDLPCALRGADQFLEKLCENLGIRVGQTTSDGQITVEAVMCLAGCHRAPMFQVQSGDGLAYHENQTVESALEVITGLRASVGATLAVAPDAPGAPAPTSAAVYEIAAKGISKVTREERVRIMEEGAQ